MFWCYENVSIFEIFPARYLPQFGAFLHWSCQKHPFHLLEQTPLLQLADQGHYILAGSSTNKELYWHIIMCFLKGLCKVGQIQKKSELTMEDGGWVQVSRGIFVCFGKSSQNIYFGVVCHVYSVCINSTLSKVVSHYDVSVLSMLKCSTHNLCLEMT